MLAGCKTLLHPRRRESFGCFEGVFDGLGGAALPGFSAFIVEDAEQMAAALGRGHGAPAGFSEGPAGEGGAEDGRRVKLAFHGEEETLGDALGLAAAGFGTFGFV